MNVSARRSSLNQMEVRSTGTCCIEYTLQGFRSRCRFSHMLGSARFPAALCFALDYADRSTFEFFDFITASLIVWLRPLVVPVNDKRFRF
jgi:hypothetical protein